MLLELDLTAVGRSPAKLTASFIESSQCCDLIFVRGQCSGWPHSEGNRTHCCPQSTFKSSKRAARYTHLEHDRSLLAPTDKKYATAFEFPATPDTKKYSDPPLSPNSKASSRSDQDPRLYAKPQIPKAEPDSARNYLRGDQATRSPRLR